MLEISFSFLTSLMNNTTTTPTDAPVNKDVHPKQTAPVNKDIGGHMHPRQGKVRTERVDMDEIKPME